MMKDHLIEEVERKQQKRSARKEENDANNATNANTQAVFFPCFRFSTVVRIWLWR
jgi:hypothetical protein